MRNVALLVSAFDPHAPEVFSETGGLPVTKRHPARLRYRIVELQRWREKRRLNFKLHPKLFPFDAKLADRFLVALIVAGYDPDPFLRRAFAALWEHDQNLAEDATSIALAHDVQLPGERTLANAQGPQYEAIYDKNTGDAIAIEVIGSPSYVLDGEVFWGQDRLDRRIERSTMLLSISMRPSSRKRVNPAQRDGA